MKTTIRFFWVPVLALSLLLGAACNTTKTSEGAVIGGTAGGVIGGVIGGEDNTAAGVIIGSAIGGTAGALIGNYMDKQAEEIEEDLEDAEVERVGEGFSLLLTPGCYSTSIPISSGRRPKKT